MYGKKPHVRFMSVVNNPDHRRGISAAGPPPQARGKFLESSPDAQFPVDECFLCLHTLDSNLSSKKWIGKGTSRVYFLFTRTNDESFSWHQSEKDLYSFFCG